MQRDDDGKRALYMTYNQTLMEMEEKGKIKGIEEGIVKGREEGRILEAVVIYRDEMHMSDELITKAIMNKFSLSLEDAEAYRKMSMAVNPYGDGLACERISAFLANV